MPACTPANRNPGQASLLTCATLLEEREVTPQVTFGFATPTTARGQAQAAGVSLPCGRRSALRGRDRARAGSSVRPGSCSRVVRWCGDEAPGPIRGARTATT